MGKYEEKDGVWRTVGGRRIFIKDGESLSDAMKKSGKFKSNKKKNEYTREELKEKYGTDNIDIINAGKEKEERVNLKEKSNFYNRLSSEDKKKYDDYIKRGYSQSDIENTLMYETQDDRIREKYMNIPEKERVQAYVDGKNWKDLVKEKDYSNTGLTEKEKAQVAESSKGALKELKAGEVKRQKEDIEKASGLKIEKSFETDLYGNGKEDRFELSDGRIVSHTTEALGKETDKWSISKFEKGSMNSKTYDSYEEMIAHLTTGSRKNETPGQTISNIERENKAYRNAYNEYKKKHPNSKISYGQFVNMSEGKK